MTNNTLIKVEHLSKKYCRSLRHTMLYGIRDIARNALGFSCNTVDLRNGEFWALDGVSFQVKRGETLGVIGANGSGKTTLLKLLNGILMPDRGRIDITGRVGALIEVGAGFHPLLTGRENIYVNGAILGMSRREIDKKFDEIADFAKIGDFIDAPVKHYSSGMFVRLGFAVAVHCDPEILLVDEVLAVGDHQFQRRCLQKIGSLQEEGKAIVFVSHALTTVEGLCTKAVWMEKGKVMREAIPKHVIDEYLLRVGSSWCNGKRSGRRWGTRQAEIFNVGLFNGDQEQIERVPSGKETHLIMHVRFNGQVKNPIFGIIVKNDLGAVVYGTNSRWQHMDFRTFEKGEEVKVIFKQPMHLIQGRYYVDAAVAYPDGLTFCDWQEMVLDFTVELSGQAEGIANLDSQIYIVEGESN